MDNLVVVRIRHALDLLGVLLRLLRLLGLQRDQLLQVLHLMLQVGGLSLTHLQLLVSLMQLGLKVVDVVLGGGQLILSMLQSGASVVEVIGLEVASAIHPHKLIVQLPDARLKVGIFLKKLSVALLKVLDGTVLGLHLTGALLQTVALVRARRYDLLKQGAHVLGVACCKRPTRMVGQKLEIINGGYGLTPRHVALVPNGEQSDGGVVEDQQVALIELREGLVGSPLQSVIEVITLSHGKPSHHGWVGGVSWNVHMDPAAPQPELMVRVATVHRKSCVAKSVQHARSKVGNPGRCNPSQRNHPSAPRVA
jgi:hypothetical protein